MVIKRLRRKVYPSIKHGFVIMSVRHLWILYESGLCILEDIFVTDETKAINETLMGGFIAALFSFSKSFSSGIDSISMGQIEMHYAVGNGIITCLAVEKKTKAELAQESVKKIHEEFLGDYSSIVKDQSAVDTSIFIPFKDKTRDILSNEKLLPKNFLHDDKKEKDINEGSEKVRTLIRKILDGENPKLIAEELRSTFTILSNSKEGKEFNKILVDFDKFIKRLDIEKETSKQLLSLTNEIRSYATINEWLG